MAIGFRRSQSRSIPGLATSLFLALSGLGASADQIQLTSGSTVTGQITGISDGQISITITLASGSAGKTVVNLSDVKTVQMAAPDAVTALKNAAPDKVIATLEPIVKNYAGLKADWVVDAMAQLAAAYESSNQDPQAVAIYTQINQLYPGSNYQNAAAAGLAQLDLQQGKVADALAKLQPVIDKASADLAPSPEQGRSYAQAFLVYGQALQQEKEFSKALEAYLTVKTMFYQNPALVAQAEQLASALRQQNPGLGVD
jgi:hypothetical protein